MDMTREELIAKALEYLKDLDVDTIKLRNARVVEAAVVYFDSGSDTKVVDVTMDRSCGKALGATISDESLFKK